MYRPRTLTRIMAHLSDSLQAELKAYLRDYFTEAIVNPKPFFLYDYQTVVEYLVDKMP